MVIFPVIIVVARGRRAGLSRNRAEASREDVGLAPAPLEPALALGPAVRLRAGAAVELTRRSAQGGPAHGGRGKAGALKPHVSQL